MEGDDEDELKAALAMSMGAPADAAAAAAGAAAAPDASPLGAAVAAIRGNRPAALEEAGTVQVLTTLLGNLVKSPGEEKFRKVKLTNAKIKKAFSCAGAEALLLAAGFTRDGEFLVVAADRPPADVAAAAQAALDAVSTACGSFALAAQLRAEGAVRCVCALPGGGFACGAMDNCIRVYQEGRLDEAPRVLLGHEKRAGVSGVLALTPDPADPGGLVSAGRDGKILLWRGGAAAATLRGHGEGVEGTNVHVVSALGRRADGALLSAGWDKTARAWDGERQCALLAGHEIAVNAVVGLPGGEVATGSGDRTIGVWRDGARVGTLQAQAPVRALCSCGGSRLASAANDGVLRLWDVAAGQQLQERKVADSYLLSVAFAPDSGLLAAGADDGSLAVLALEGTSLHLVQTLQLCGEVYGVAFLSSGDLAAACGDDSCVVWTRNPSRAAASGLRQDYSARVAAMAAARQAAGGSAAAPAPGGGGTWDFSFPVDFGRQKMTLQWNRGEPAQAVALRFLQQNGLEQSHLQDVITFVTQAQAQQGAAAGGGGGGASDFSYPVEVADGRRLTISWNRGEDPQQVAAQFAARNGIGMHELPDIVAFVQQVSGGPAAPMMMQQAPAQVPAASPEVQQRAMQTVMEMGFDEPTARAALQASGWSVEVAISRLLG